MTDPPRRSASEAGRSALVPLVEALSGARVLCLGDLMLDRIRDVSIGTDPLSTLGGVANPRAEANGKPVYFVIDGEIWTARSVDITGSVARYVCVQSPLVESGRDGLRSV